MQDGKLRVFKWPSMEIMFTEDQAHKTVKQIDFRFVIIEVSKNKMCTSFYMHCVDDDLVLQP